MAGLSCEDGVYGSLTKNRKTRALIEARFKEGFTLENFKTVHQVKVADWLHSPEFRKYLRPVTLYGSKFESYLNQPDAPLKTVSEKTVLNIQNADNLLKRLTGDKNNV